MNDTYSVILLADRDGQTFHSQYPSALAEVLFQPLALWSVDCCRQAGLCRICALTGEFQEVKQLLEGEGVMAVSTQEQTADFLNGSSSAVLVLPCDLPLLEPQVLLDALRVHEETGASVTALDCGVFWLDSGTALCLAEKGGLHDLISQTQKLDCAVQQYELAQQPRKAASRRDLLELTQEASRRKIDDLMDQGVGFTSLDGVLIGPWVTVGADTIIHSGTHLKGAVSIGCRCQIGPNTVIGDSVIGDDTTIHSSLIEQSRVGSGVRFGPNSHLRPNSVLGDKVKVGNFVEVKNSTIGEATSVAHLTYIGDTDMGAHVNVGCGVVCVNYNGYTKARTTVGDNAFIGCNTNLVAPVTVESGAYTAAGSTITDKVPENALAIARARQSNHEGWALRHREKYKDQKKK